MTYAGTAGAMLDFSAVLGVFPSRSSFSSIFFSLEIMRLDVMAASQGSFGGRGELQ